MIYLINEQIHFRPEDGAIWEADKKESEVTVTITMSRLLTLLLQKRGEVVTRDEILTKVWDAHGLRSSNNSLNKYIAELRKVFVSFNIHDEVITTVPRIGFMLAGTITVEPLEEETEDISPEHPPAPIILQAEKGEIKKKNVKNTLFAPVAFAISTITIVSVLLQFSQTLFNTPVFRSDSLEEHQTYKLGKYESCDIETIQQSSREMTSVKLHIAKDVVKRSGMQCLANTVFYFQPSDPVVYEMPGRVFLSRCTFNKDNSAKFAACKNYYEVSYVYNN